MTKTTIPISLPFPNPTKAYWQTPPHPLSDHRTTPSLPPSAKYAIIGSGITGAITAYKILALEPSASIVLLEARQACSGATGRNGGHCRAGRYLEFGRYVEDFGEEEALLMEKLEEENVKHVGEFVKRHDIECDLRAVETMDVFTDEAKWEHALSALEARKKVLEGKVEASVLTKHRIWSAKETREELLIPEGVGAVSFPAYALSPYKLVCRILELCIAKGMNLQTNTPVLEISQSSSSSSRGPNHCSGWTVHTDRGDIRAENVVLATNAYSSALYPPLTEFLIPTRAQVAAVRPGSNIVNNPALKRTMGLESHVSGDYMQSRAEGGSGAGDIIIGGGRRLGTPLGEKGEQPILDDSTIHPRISKYLTHAAAGYFGRENWGDDGEVLQEWTGIMGYTLDSQPVVGEAPGQKGLWVCVGFNGHGMALTLQSAEALVQLMMGKEKEVDEWLPKNYRIQRVPKRIRR
ncbi:FAD dependent oxidoreductase superfamily protein [Rhexocercosporidium sp. MPI-PUGE-AT-0058]|nr:FAD dependent oxidoreductase superfamily protein [Rhexocercosporidium sp. MPI-PUGE-AT-0058]